MSDASHVRSSSAAIQAVGPKDTLNVNSPLIPDLRSVALPGLHNASFLGILVTGHLEKRRDGAVRGGWATRLFILSSRALHYYRKGETNELYGRERGQISLQDVECAKIVPTEQAAYHPEPSMTSFYFALLTKKKATLMILRAQSLEIATAWMAAINHAIMIAKSVNFSSKWPSDVTQSYLLTVSGKVEKDRSRADSVSSSDEAIAATKLLAPKILAVSMKSNGCETVISRHVELGKELSLGPLDVEDTCIMVLSNGEDVRLNRAMLDKDLSSLLTIPKQITLTTPSRCDSLHLNIVSRCRIEGIIRCTQKPLSSKFESNLKIPHQSTAPTNECTTFTTAFSTVLGCIFILSCILSYYCAKPFEGLMKLTAFLGFLQSVSQIIQFIVCSKSDAPFARSLTRLTKNQVALRSAENVSQIKLTFHLALQKIEVIEFNQSEAAAASIKSGDMQSVSSHENPEFSIPLRFIAAEKGNVEKGEERYKRTLQWRKENQMDQLLWKPHVNFATIKKHYPQYFHGRSKAGHPVYYEQPGKINLAALKEQDLSIDDLISHYMYITEYLWTIIEPNDSARSITVLDVTGIGMSDLGGEVLDFIKRASSFTGTYYPERSARILIINIPGWFNMIWRMVKPLIDPVTRDKVHMLKGKQAIIRNLEELINLDQIPADFGGEGVHLGESIEEIELQRHVEKYNEKAT